MSGVTPIGGCAGGNTHDQYHHVQFTQTLAHVHVPDVELGDGVEDYEVTYDGGFRSGWGSTPPEWPDANDAHGGLDTGHQGTGGKSADPQNLNEGQARGPHDAECRKVFAGNILYSDESGFQTIERYYVTTIEYEMKADGSVVDKDGNPLTLDDDNPQGTEEGGGEESEGDGEGETREE